MTTRRFAGLSLAASLIFVGTSVFTSENPVAEMRNASASAKVTVISHAPSISRLAGTADDNIPITPQDGLEKTQTPTITDGSDSLTQTDKDAALMVSEATDAIAVGAGVGNESEAQANVKFET